MSVAKKTGSDPLDNQSCSLARLRKFTLPSGCEKTLIRDECLPLNQGAIGRRIIAIALILISYRVIDSLGCEYELSSEVPRHQLQFQDRQTLQDDSSAPRRELKVKENKLMKESSRSGPCNEIGNVSARCIAAPLVSLSEPQVPAGYLVRPMREAKSPNVQSQETSRGAPMSSGYVIRSARAQPKQTRQQRTGNERQYDSANGGRGNDGALMNPLEPRSDKHCPMDESVTVCDRVSYYPAEVILYKLHKAKRVLEEGYFNLNSFFSDEREHSKDPFEASIDVQQGVKNLSSVSNPFVGSSRHTNGSTTNRLSDDERRLMTPGGYFHGATSASADAPLRFSPKLKSTPSGARESAGKSASWFVNLNGENNKQRRPSDAPSSFLTHSGPQIEANIDSPMQRKMAIKLTQGYSNSLGGSSVGQHHRIGRGQQYRQSVGRPLAVGDFVDLVERRAISMVGGIGIGNESRQKRSLSSSGSSCGSGSSSSSTSSTPTRHQAEIKQLDGENGRGEVRVSAESVLPWSLVSPEVTGSYYLGSGGSKRQKGAANVNIGHSSRLASNASLVSVKLAKPSGMALHPSEKKSSATQPAISKVLLIEQARREGRINSENATLRLRRQILAEVDAGKTGSTSPLASRAMNLGRNSAGSNSNMFGDFVTSTTRLSTPSPPKLMALRDTQIARRDVNSNSDGEIEMFAQGSSPTLEDEPLCRSRSIYISPRAALNDKKQWKYVVNIPEKDPQIRQVIRVDICVNPFGSCTDLLSLPLGFTSQCKQKYAKKKLLALDPQNGFLELDTFFIPSCCVCQLVRDAAASQGTGVEDSPL